MFSPHSSFPSFLRTCLSSICCLPSLGISVVLGGNDWLFGFLLQHTQVTAFPSLKQLPVVRLFPRFQSVSFVVCCLLFVLVHFWFFSSSCLYCHCFVRLSEEIKIDICIQCCLIRSFDAFINSILLCLGFTSFFSPLIIAYLLSDLI